MSERLYKVWGSNLRRYREAQDISRATMAEELHTTLATVSRWENGLVMPRDGQKLKIAEYLGVPPSAIFPLMEVRS